MKYNQRSVSPGYLSDLEEEEELQFISDWNLYLASDLDKKISVGLAKRTSEC